jgi:hypothetical protein
MEKKFGDPKKIGERELKMKMVDGKKFGHPKRNLRAEIEKNRSTEKKIW